MNIHTDMTPASPTLPEMAESMARDFGWPVLPVHSVHDGLCSCGKSECTSKGKHPSISNGVHGATRDLQLIRAWFEGSDSNVAIATGGEARLLVIDVDPRNGGEESEARLWQDLGGLPVTVTVETGGGGRHYYFEVPADWETKLSSKLVGYPGIDVKWNGGYVVAPPSMHTSGRRYAFAVGRGPWGVPVAPAPGALLERLGKTRTLAGRALQDSGQFGIVSRIPEGTRNETLFRRACALRARGLDPSELARQIHALNDQRCDPPLDYDEVERLIESASRYPVGFDGTEAGFAQRFVYAHANRVRYCRDLLRWVIWDGRVWRFTCEIEITRLALEVVDRLLADAEAEGEEKKVKAARRFKGKGPLRAAIELAKSHIGLEIDFAAFDTHPGLLNVRNGVVDLETGSIRPHDPGLYITQIIDLDYRAGARGDRWNRFVDEITCGDGALAGYLQRVCGYAATGLTLEQVFFVLRGGGANGKSTFVDAVRSVFGGYAQTLPSETLLAKPLGGGIPNDIARLRGARMAVASEFNEGAKINEALIKQLSGGDSVTARELYKSFFEFQPTVKLILLTNHRLQTRGGDPAMVRRIREIPFSARFDEANRDPNLLAALRSEREAILAWMINGARAYFAHGLREPPAVVIATRESATEMDDLPVFLTELTVNDPSASIRTTTLYHEYKAWSEDSGHSPMARGTWTVRLKKLGFISRKTGGDMRIVGLRMKEPQ